MSAAGLVCTLHLGRSGSTVLGDLLNQNPYIMWDGEIYEPGRRLMSVGADPVEVMRQRLAQVKKGFYGFELKPFHCRLMGRPAAEVVGALRQAGVTHWIVLKRENYLRKIASTAVARVTGQWHRQGERALQGGTARRVAVRIDPEAHFIDAETRPITYFFAGYDRFFADVESWLNDLPVLRLSYEQHLQSDPLAGYRRVCRFLNIAPMPVAVRYAPTTPYPLAEVIENLDEVVRALEGTPWAAMAAEQPAVQESTSPTVAGRSSGSR